MNNRIREWREARGLSQEKLGEAVGTSGQQISRLEKSTRRLTTDWMERLSVALTIEAPELMARAKTGRDQTQPSPKSELVKDPDELALLRFWKDMNDGQRATVLRVVEAISRPDDT